MHQQADISAEIYDDEVVCFLADRYHTTPRKVIECFLVQDGIHPERNEDTDCFQLEENEMEILRGLTSGSRS